MGRTGGISKAALVVGAALMSGCYTYTPVERPTPGSTVRIEVPIRSAVSGVRTPDEVASMEGRLLSAGDSLVLEMATVREIGNFRRISSVDTLRVARTNVSTVSTRMFSKPRTIGLTAVIAGLTTAVAIAAIGLGGGGAGTDGPGGGTTTGAPRIHLGFSSLLQAIGR